MTGSYAQFAQFMGFSKQYVGKLKKQGRLVFVGDKIDFAKSKAKIAKTADVSRENIIDKGGKKESATVTAPQKEKPETNESTGGIGTDASIKEQFNLARAAFQGYQAKLKKIEYEQARRNLGSLDQIQKVGFEIGKIIKTRMATFAIRAAPVVTHETSEKANREYLMREIENVIAEIREALEQTNQ